MFTVLLSLPPNSLHYREVDPDGSIFIPWAVHLTAATVPAFIRKHDQRKTVLDRIWNQNVHGTSFDTKVALCACLLIKDEWPVGRYHIWGEGEGSLS
tara:strand:+ start:1260 stop:1550 length:291 start_codon:yes stop_codon:yes gene_type:complete